MSPTDVTAPPLAAAPLVPRGYRMWLSPVVSTEAVRSAA